MTDHIELLKRCRFTIHAVLKNNYALMSHFTDDVGNNDMTFGEYRASKVDLLAHIDKAIAENDQRIAKILQV